MELEKLSATQSLNKAFLKVKPHREHFERFKEQLSNLLSKTNVSESEEFHKHLIIDFLKKSYYDTKYFINTKARNDLVIHSGADASSTVSVIIETKRPSNASEMLRTDNINVKALHELIFYYLRERVENENLEIKHLIVSNLHEWFIFDATVFEKNFYQSKKLLQKFIDFTAGRLAGISTDFFYKEVAAPFVSNLETKIQFTHLDLRPFKTKLKKNSELADNQIIALFKIFSPEHLLKLPFTNDSNTLDKGFYTELLHLIGLSETKEGSKKVIDRKAPDLRNPASLLENAMTRLSSSGKINNLTKPSQFGETTSDRLFNVALELSITWINRILFLKLLEGQLIAYHRGDTSYAFLHKEKIRTFDDLELLFFEVLAQSIDQRSEEIKKLFPTVPYLNSSLFEPTDIEQNTVFIGGLRDGLNLPILTSTVLKGPNGRRRTGELGTIEYLLSFLDSYDFSTESSSTIQEDNKSIINASVLGLIFEKINGYKYGAFFTPGYVTTYISRESIRKSVVNRFNQEKNWQCTNLIDVYNKIDNTAEANAIINNIKICDPAVGSGHFLVSALNEIIAIKHDLKILCDQKGNRLKEYTIEIINDELIITDEDGDLFEYKPKSAEAQRVQETIFHEKETIIENCLFGVDISSNSAKICRLRLWIELLKNAYYKPTGELETLPNIDINIKSGDSLISRFSLDTDLKQALRKSKSTLAEYKKAVSQYRTARSKDEKAEMMEIITKIKNNFRSEISSNDPDIKRLQNLNAQLMTLQNQHNLFEESPREILARKKKIAELELGIDKLDALITEIRNNKIFENAFEWRFEFPEALNDSGDFVGFDLIIGNPPYGVSVQGKAREHIISTVSKVPDHEIYYWFVERAHQLLNPNGHLAYIIPNTLLFNVNAEEYRNRLLDKWEIQELLDCTKFNIFSDAVVSNVILSMQRSTTGASLGYKPTANASTFQELVNLPPQFISKEAALQNIHNWGLAFKLPEEILNLTSAIKSSSTALSTLFPSVSQGLIAYDSRKNQSAELIKNRAYHFSSNPKGQYKLWLSGSDVTRYCIKWNEKEYIDYCPGIANPRNPKYFLEKRILVREITNPRVFATITKEEYYHDPSIIAILDSKMSHFKLETLLAILNSKLATFYHFNTSPKATKGLFPKILIKDINSFPLPIDVPVEINSELARLADLMNSPAESLQQRTDLDAKIDSLVYSLYKLSPEQVAIIEKRV